MEHTNRDYSWEQTNLLNFMDFKRPKPAFTGTIGRVRAYFFFLLGFVSGITAFSRTARSSPDFAQD